MHVEDGFGSMTRAKRCSCRLPTGLIDTTTLSAHRDSGNGPGQLEAFRLRCVPKKNREENRLESDDFFG
jgi:hypothetical protein